MDDITAVVAARNEAARIATCLSTLTWCDRVLVIDSQSTDGTPDIARSCGAEVIQFTYLGGYPKKRQWVLDSQTISSSWVLLVDADELVQAPLADEIRQVLSVTKCDAYLCRKQFHFLGRTFRFGGFSFDAVVLFRRGAAWFERGPCGLDSGLDMEVHERLHVRGRIGRLVTPLVHCDDRGLARYIEKHNQYSTWEAQMRLAMLGNGPGEHSLIEPRLLGNIQERRRWLKRIATQLPGESLLWFIYHYVLRLGFLEGYPGLVASRLRSDYIAQVRAKMWERRFVDQS